MTEPTLPSLAQSILSQLAQRPVVNEVWYLDKELSIDGYKFVKCRFDRCKLNISSANFEFENCYIDESTQIYYSGTILKPIRLFNSRYPWAYEHMPFFAPTRNPDGTITIKS